MNLISRQIKTNDNKAKLFVVNEKCFPEDIGRKIYVQFFIRKDKAIKRMIAFLDSGADISICQESYIMNIFNKNELKKLNITPQNCDVMSFSNNSIKVKYKITINISFTPYSTSLPVNFYIISDIPGAPLILLGADFMKSTLMQTAYTGETDNPSPEIRIERPTPGIVKTLYCTENDIYTCEAYVNLKPNHNQTIKFYLHEASPCLEKDSILISGQDIDHKIYITPSKSKIVLDLKKNQYFGFAFVQNLSSIHKTLNLKATYERITTERSIPASPSNKHKLLNLSVVHDVLPFDLQTETNISFKSDFPETKEQCSILPSNLYSISTELNIKENKQSDISPEELNKFYDRKHTAICDPEFEDTGDVNDDIDTRHGHTIAEPYLKTAEEIVNLESFDPIHRPYIEDIFIKSFPNILARGVLESGNLSKTLGYYHLRLKENQTLPRYKKIFFLSPHDSQHLKDILSFLLKNNIIIKAPISDQGDLFGSPSYLIPKSNPNSHCRLIIDYRYLNSILACEANLLPDIPNILHSLRGANFFSKTDLSNAYYSYKITPSSRWLTAFNTPFGQYHYVSIPTGIKSACICFAKLSQKMLHERVCLDNNGNPIYETKNLVKTIPDPIKETINYFDDVIVFTPAQKTYEESIKFHYEKVKLVISRLAFHDSRISFEKSVFCKTKMSFLGWLISNQFIMVNPKRLIKIKEAEFPPTQKAMRSFLGLINSLRLALNFKNLEKVKHLTPLTSSKVKYQPTPFHVEVFKEIKQKLMERPIFSNMICPKSPKILFTDASVLNNSSYSCVLAQIVENDTSESYVPPFLCLDDPVHQIIFDTKMAYQPIPIIRSIEECKEFHKSLFRTDPPLHEYLEHKYLGYTEEELNDTFFISIQSIQYAYRCIVVPIKTLRERTVKQINKSIIRLKLKDFEFKNDNLKTKQYLEDLKINAPIDSQFLAIESFSYALYRPVVVISSLPEHSKQPIFKFNFNIIKPPFIVGAYKKNDRIIFLPFFVNKETSYDLTQLKNKFQIVAFHSKGLPETKRGRGILDHELFSILNSLDAMRRYIGSSDVTLLTDSKPLYLIFNQDIHRSSTRLFRWSLKLRVDWSGLKIQYIPSNSNLADFLSKKFNVLPGDLPRLDLKQVDVNDLSNYLPKDKIWTVDEWATWVANNPGHLRIISEGKSTKLLASSLTKVTKNLEKHMSPLKVLEERISHDKIQQSQKIHLKQLYENCLSSKDFLYKDKSDEYKLSNGIIFQLTTEGPKIVLPQQIVGLFLAYAHLSTNHGGLKKLQSALDNYIFPEKTKTIYNFVSRCYACMINNKSTRQNVLGIYPINSYPFQTLYLDLAENIGPAGPFQHLLIATCSLTDCILIFPLKTKTATEVSHIILYSILQYYNVQNIFSDNGACFSDKKFISFLAALNITKLTLSAMNPQGKGLIEAKVKIVKTVLKKMLVLHENYVWSGLPYLISKLNNTSVSNKTNYTPFEFIYSPDSPNSKFLDNTLVKLHPLVQNDEIFISKYREDIKNMITEARDSIQEFKIKQQELLNKNKIDKKFKPNDIVFCLDRSYIAGNTRPLRSKFSETPWKVISVLPVSLLISRLSDGYQQIYSKNDCKKYTKLDPTFTNLPMEVLNIIKGNTDNISTLEQSILQKTDPFDIPDGKILNPPETTDTDKTENNSPTLPLEKINIDPTPHPPGLANTSDLTEPEHDNSETIDYQPPTPYPTNNQEDIEPESDKYPVTPLESLSVDSFDGPMPQQLPKSPPNQNNSKISAEGDEDSSDDDIDRPLQLRSGKSVNFE